MATLLTAILYLLVRLLMANLPKYWLLRLTKFYMWCNK